MSRFLPLHIAALVLIVAHLYVLYGREHAPADLPKEAASFDLPIALGILVGSDAIRPQHLNEAINYRMLDRQLWT